MKILLAEDSRTSQQLGVLILEDEGHSVEVANNGLEAVEKSAIDSFDLILMDVEMPELDGLQATAQIRQREQSCQSGSDRKRIIAMTAQDGADDRQRCLEAGMDDFVSKPLCPDELLAALTRVGQASTQQPAPSEPETVSSSDLLVDWDAALRSVGSDQSILDTVVEAALEELPRLMKQLNQAIESSSFEVIKRSAHTINGALRIFSPRQAIEIAGQIERHAASGSLEKITPLVPQLKVLLEEVSQELQRPH